MNASVATVTMSKKSAAIEAVNQLIRTTDMNQEGKECTVINSSEPVQEPSDASLLPGMPQTTSQEVVSVPKKRAAPKKSKKNDEAAAASSDEVVPSVDGEAVPVEEDHDADVRRTSSLGDDAGNVVEASKPKKRAAPKKTKKNDEASAAASSEVVVDGAVVPVEEKPKKRAAPKKTKKNEEKNVVINEQTSAILEEDIISNVVAEAAAASETSEEKVEEPKETKKITTLRAPIDYLQPFLQNVPNVASFPQELKEPFVAWLKTLGKSEWKTMTVFPDVQKKEDHDVMEASEAQVHTQNMDDFEEIEMIVQECVIDGELYLIDSDQNLYHPETLAYVRNMNYET